LYHSRTIHFPFSESSEYVRPSAPLFENAGATAPIAGSLASTDWVTASISQNVVSAISDTRVLPLHDTRATGVAIRPLARTPGRASD
jgi:hypothetical protein